MKEIFEKLIYEALRKAEVRNINIYTFALYHDHESHVATVCIDTIENSERSVLSSNEFCKAQFMKAVEGGSIDRAISWNSNCGRSLSLGDFAYKNISEIDVPKKPKNPDFYLEMVEAIVNMSELISRQSKHGKKLFYCCSNENSEVGLIWS